MTRIYFRILCSVFGLPCILLQGAHAQEFLNLNTNVTVEPASNINTKHLEYAPTYYGPGIVFVHAKPDDKAIDLRLGMSFFELMYAELGPDGLPGKAVSFSPNIRTRFHEGPSAFTRDLKQVFFTRSNISNGQNVVGANKQTTMKIYLADKGPEDWENPRELPFCSNDYTVQCPTLSPDDQQIVFMSDMPGGYGGWDLYIANRYSGTWSEPVNLGPAINTAKNERLPYWHPRGVLFFSSDGHNGFGGLDIYAVLDQKNGRFSAPVNLGPRFNSRQDDLSFICDEDGITGFFASARREGLGKDDIYYFTSDQSIFSTSFLESSLIVDMSLSVRDAYSLTPIPEASVWIFPIGPLGPEGLEDYFEKIVLKDAQGVERINLSLKEGVSRIPPYVTDIKGTAPVELRTDKDYLVMLYEDTYQQREVTLRKESILEGNEYYIDMDRRMELSSGPVPNKDCFTAAALVLGTTTQMPVPGVLVQVRSTCTGTVQVMETDNEGRFRTCLIPGCDYQVRLLKTGYLEHNYRHLPGTDAEDRIVYFTEEDLEARAGGTPEAGDVLILENIYYDFNKSAIRTGDARELESLAAMMKKYPDMTIELLSHTDSRGTAEYNMELAERRGVSVREFLIARGVAASRVRLKPMGESQLRNDCKDGVQCTDEEHQKNRRTEIRILNVDPEVEIRYSDQ